MLTVDFGRLPVGPGDRVLDLGCGAGRHAFEALRRGAHVVALDADAAELREVAGDDRGHAGGGRDPGQARPPRAVCGDATAMPFPDGAFDRVIAAEVLEHIPADQHALGEIARVLRPGGAAGRDRAGLAAGADLLAAVRRLPQHARRPRPDLHPGGDGGQAGAAGLRVGGHHHAHGLHSPYWWLKCAVGVHDDDHPLARAYHRLLVWDIMQRPAGDPAGRAGAQPAHRQEPRHLRGATGRGRPAPSAPPRPPTRAHAACLRRLAQLAGPAQPAAGAGRAWPNAACRARARHPDRRPRCWPPASIAAGQQPSGAIGWPDGHVDAWNHVECAMALSVCGLNGAAAAGLRMAAAHPARRTARGRSGPPATR